LHKDTKPNGLYFLTLGVAEETISSTSYTYMKKRKYSKKDRCLKAAVEMRKPFALKDFNPFIQIEVVHLLS